MATPPDKPTVRFWRDPDLPGVEVRYSDYHKDAFREHTHAQYSVGFLESGRTTFSLQGGAHSAVGGQMVFIGPEVAHACNPDPNSNMAYCMFYVDAPLVEQTAAEVFGHAIGPVTFVSPVVDDPELADRWRTLYRLIVDGGQRLEKESLLVQGLADVIARHGRRGACVEPSANAPAVRAVKEYLAVNLSAKVSLEELSGVAHLSRYHLLRIFQAETGLPPHAYQNQLRVDLGKRLLTDGLSISRTAAEAGFVDQSHFTRVFKQYTGATPRQYQADRDTRR